MAMPQEFYEPLFWVVIGLLVLMVLGDRHFTKVAEHLDDEIAETLAKKKRFLRRPPASRTVARRSLRRDRPLSKRRQDP